MANDMKHGNLDKCMGKSAMNELQKKWCCTSDLKKSNSRQKQKGEKRPKQQDNLKMTSSKRWRRTAFKPILITMMMMILNKPDKYKNYYF